MKWDILLSGVPVTSTRGALGWSSAVLVRTEDHRVLIDTGSYGDRSLLLSRLREIDVAPEDIDILFLTHFHYDHVLNFDLFRNARFYLSRAEIRYLEDGGYRAAGDCYVPAAVFGLMSHRMESFDGESELLPGLRTVPLPGHTPGTTGLLLEREGTLIAGDGVKNAHEFLHGRIPPVFGSPEDALRSYRKVADLSRTVIPGHDLPFHLPITGHVEYLEGFSRALDIVFSGAPDAKPQTIHLP